MQRVDPAFDWNSNGCMRLQIDGDTAIVREEQIGYNGTFEYDTVRWLHHTATPTGPRQNEGPLFAPITGRFARWLRDLRHPDHC
jgi:hypothetical protein